MWWVLVRYREGGGEERTKNNTNTYHPSRQFSRLSGQWDRVQKEVIYRQVHWVQDLAYLLWFQLMQLIQIRQKNLKGLFCTRERPFRLDRYCWLDSDSDVRDQKHIYLHFQYQHVDLLPILLYMNLTEHWINRTTPLYSIPHQCPTNTRSCERLR